MAEQNRDHDGPFRDFMPGMEGRRADLLRRRRDELATMPLALRRVYVARVARVSAAMAACVGGAVLVGASLHPGYEQHLATLFPGKYPAVLSTLLLGTLLVSALCYLLGRCVAEARFTHAMSKCVLPDGDICTDVERLNATRPDALASAMIARFESPAAVLPPAAMALAGPAAVIYGAMALLAGGYPKEAAVDATFAVQGATLLTIGLAGISAALYLGLSRGRGSWKRSALVGTGLAAATTLVMHLASNASAWVWGGFALVAGSLTGSLALLAREHRIVVLDDLGASLWTVRGTLTAGWELGKRACAQITWTNIKKLPSMTRAGLKEPVGKFAATGAVLAIACGGYLAYDSGDPALVGGSHSTGQAAMDTHVDDIRPEGPVAVQHRRGEIAIEDTTVTGSMRLMATDDAFALRDTSGHQLSIPAGYKAQVTVELTGTEETDVELLVDGEPYASASDGALKWIRLGRSDERRILAVRTYLGKGVNATLRYQVTLDKTTPELN